MDSNDQQHQALLLRRTSENDLTRSPRPKMKYSIGAKVSMVDHVWNRHLEDSVEMRLDGIIEGYEQIYDDLPDYDYMYKWAYLVRFVHHGHVRDIEEDEVVTTPVKIPISFATFLKFLSEEEVSQSLSNDNPEYIIDKNFGRNLREMIEFRGRLVRRDLVPLLPPTVDWGVFLKDLKRIPNIAKIEFVFFDREGNINGYFTVLTLAILVLTVHQRHRHLETIPLPYIVSKIVDADPEAVKQGRYDLGRNRSLGILCFLLEFDSDEGGDEGGDDYNEVDFAKELNPKILEILITSSGHHGQYLATEFCPYIEDWMPLRRFLAEYYTITGDEYLDDDGEQTDVKMMISPQAQVILENDWRAAAFLLCEQFIGTVNHNQVVLDYLLDVCISKRIFHAARACFDHSFGRDHEDDSGIEEWFAKCENKGVPSSLIATMFKFLVKKDQDLFRKCLELYNDGQMHLLLPTSKDNWHEETLQKKRGRERIENEEGIDLGADGPLLATMKKKKSRDEINQREAEAAEGGKVVDDVIEIYDSSRCAIPLPPSSLFDDHYSSNTNTNIASLMNCVLDSLAIFYHHSFVLQSCRCAACSNNNCKVMNDMWRRFSSKTFVIDGMVQKNTSMEEEKRISLNEKLLPTTKNNNSNLLTLCNRHDHHRYRPLYTAIRRKHAWRTIVRDVVKLDPSVLHSVDCIELLPPFALAATVSCSQSLAIPFSCDHNNKDVSIERIYELLRANPAVLVVLLASKKKK